MDVLRFIKIPGWRARLYIARKYKGDRKDFARLIKNWTVSKNDPNYEGRIREAEVTFQEAQELQAKWDSSHSYENLRDLKSAGFYYSCSADFLVGLEDANLIEVAKRYSKAGCCYRKAAQEYEPGSLTHSEVLRRSRLLCRRARGVRAEAENQKS